jgi:protease IV
MCFCEQDRPHARACAYGRPPCVAARTGLGSAAIRRALSLSLDEESPYELKMTVSGQNYPASAMTDYLVDRRKMRRKVTFWRIAALTVALLALIGFAARLRGSGPHIARVAIEGIITGDERTLKLLHDIRESNASAVIVSIESPGGTTTGAERLYDAIRQLAEKKPVVAMVGTMAASGGYIAALAADTIIARGNSLVGSIGVLFQYPNVSKLLATVGVQVEEVKSSPLKAAPNGFEPTSDAARAALAALVADSFDWFKGLVRERRKMNDEELAQVVDGRVFTGRQAVPLKLIDQIGGEREAISWLEKEKNIAKGLPVRTWRTDRSLETLGILGSIEGLADRFGLSAALRLLQRGSESADARLLDGLVSVWQAPSAG